MLSRSLVWVSLAGLAAGGWLIVGDAEDKQGVVPDQAERSVASKDWQTQLMRMATSTDDSGSRFWPFAALIGKTEPMPKVMRRAAIASLGGHQRLGLQFDRAQYVNTSIGRWNLGD